MNAQLPTGMPRGPPVMLTCVEPEHCTPAVSQNWLAARVVLLPASGSSGGFSSLLTKSPLLTTPVRNSYIPPLRNQQWPPPSETADAKTPGETTTLLEGIPCEPLTEGAGNPGSGRRKPERVAPATSGKVHGVPAPLG